MSLIGTSRINQPRPSLSPIGLIPKLRNLDSCYPALCGDDRIVNMSQIKHLDGRHQPATTPQVGRG
jgi:hypothetical protein